MSTTTQKLNSTKILYWLSTGLIALFAIPGVFYMNSEMALAGARVLGIPEWFRIELGIGQPIGALIILLQSKKLGRVREWAYVALGIKYISAAYAHVFIGGEVGNVVFALILLGVLATSYFTWHKMHTIKN